MVKFYSDAEFKKFQYKICYSKIDEKKLSKFFVFKFQYKICYSKIRTYIIAYPAKKISIQNLL